MRSNNLCEGEKSNQYWSPIEAVLVSMSNQYYSMSRPVLLTEPTSTGRNHPSAQSYYYKHLQKEYFPRVRAMRAHDIL